LTPFSKSFSDWRFLGHGNDFIFDAGDAEALDILAGGPEEMISTPAGPRAGIGFVALIVVPVEMRLTTYLTGLGVSFLICSMRARAAEGLE